MKENREAANEYVKTIKNHLDAKKYSPWFLIRIYYNFYKYAQKYDTDLQMSIRNEIQKIYDIEHEYSNKNVVNEICEEILFSKALSQDNPFYSILKSGYILGTLSYWGFIFKFEDIDLMNY
tara:strand:+ start:192 stop:554 length:363 start_codon:yes stop_codon:yes gene_type:complete